MDINNIQRATNLLAEWHEIRLFLEKYPNYSKPDLLIINDLEFKPPFKDEFSKKIAPAVHKAVRQIFEDVKADIEDELAKL
jgi:hypothetical protein